MRLKMVQNPKRSKLAALLVVTWVSTLAGCSICPSPYDYDYGTFGSRTPRTDMRKGRVGSIFSDPALVGPSSDAQSNAAGPGEYDEYYEGEIIDGVPLDDFEGIEIHDPGN